MTADRMLRASTRSRAGSLHNDGAVSRRSTCRIILGHSVRETGIQKHGKRRCASQPKGCLHRSRPSMVSRKSTRETETEAPRDSSLLGGLLIVTGISSRRFIGRDVGACDSVVPTSGRLSCASGGGNLEWLRAHSTVQYWLGLHICWTGNGDLIEAGAAQHLLGGHWQTHGAPAAVRSLRTGSPGPVLMLVRAAPQGTNLATRSALRRQPTTLHRDGSSGAFRDGSRSMHATRGGGGMHGS